MGLSREELLMLRTAALLHDIGKLAIPGSLVVKKGLLTETERRIIETHPMEGARLLAPMERYGSVISVVLQHHERIDGSGYPLGLRGSEISLHSRIVAVADTFDAITSPRAYHLGKPSHIALREITKHRGTHFDAAVADALEEMLS
jgi:putative nucleotidyltransferase with HDIG domain